MTYTFIEANYANKEHTAALANTEEAAWVVLSAADTPEEWQSLIDSDIEIAPFPEPETNN